MLDHMKTKQRLDSYQSSLDDKRHRLNTTKCLADALRTTYMDGLDMEGTRGECLRAFSRGGFKADPTNAQDLTVTTLPDSFLQTVCEDFARQEYHKQLTHVWDDAVWMLTYSICHSYIKRELEETVTRLMRVHDQIKTRTKFADEDPMHREELPPLFQLARSSLFRAGDLAWKWSVLRETIKPW